MRTMGPVLRFYLRVGARLGLRVLVTGTAVGAGVLGLLRMDFVVALAEVLFGRAGLVSAVAVVGGTMGAAAVAAPRITTGMGGWLRQLPVAGAWQRRTAVVAVGVATGSVWVFLVLLVGVAARFRPDSRSAAQVAGVVAAGLAAGLVMVPCERRAVVAALAVGAGLAANLGGWWMVAAGIVLLLAADRGRVEAGAVVLVASHDLAPFAAAARALTLRDGRCRIVEPLPAAAAAGSLLLERMARGE